MVAITSSRTSRGYVTASPVDTPPPHYIRPLHSARYYNEYSGIGAPLVRAFVGGGGDSIITTTVASLSCEWHCGLVNWGGMTTLRSSVRPKSSKQPWGTILKPEFGMGYQPLTGSHRIVTINRIHVYSSMYV